MTKLLTTTAIALLLATGAAAQELTLATNASNAGPLDPHVSTTTHDKIVFGMMFNGLVRFAPGSMTADSLEPDLAESWERSEDGLVWTFHLREGVQFHRGYGTLTADDVVYSLTRAGDPEQSAVSSDYASFESVEALDDHTVRITLLEGVPSLLGLVANYHGGNIVSAAAAEELGDGFRTAPVGTGPFAFDELSEGQYLRMVAHDDYFRGRPQIDTISYRYIPATSARELAFRNGELHAFVGTREDRWVNRMRDGEAAVVDVFEPGELRTLHLNASMEPFDDIRVRQAVAHAINRDELVAFMGPSVARRNDAPVPAGYLGHAAGMEALPYDPDRARALLAEAGLPDGFSTTVHITERTALLTPMEVIQAQLAQVGIDIELEVVEHSAWHAAIRDNVSAMVLYGAARFPVADTYLTQFYHSNSIVGTPTAVTNFSHCTVADDEITAARSEPDPARQLELWETAQRAIVEDVCAIPLFELLQVWARAPDLNYGFDLTGSLSLGPVITEQATLGE